MRTTTIETMEPNAITRMDRDRSDRSCTTMHDHALRVARSLTRRCTGQPSVCVTPPLGCMTMHGSFIHAVEAAGSLIDFVSGWPADSLIAPDGIVFVERYHMVSEQGFRVRLHRWLGSDPGRALHDHPWDSHTLVLAGELIEHTVAGSRILRPGASVRRVAPGFHRMELVGAEAWTLFQTGPVVRSWGFLTPDGWVRWRDYGRAGSYGPVDGHPLPGGVSGA